MDKSSQLVPSAERAEIKNAFFSYLGSFSIIHIILRVCSSLKRLGNEDIYLFLSYHKPALVQTKPVTVKRFFGVASTIMILC